MQSLMKLQNAFQLFLLENNPQIIASIYGKNADTVKRHLQIYRDAYEIRLSNVIQEDFPVTRQVLGEKEFAEKVRHYVQQYPSSYFSLDQYGAHFPAFLYDENALFAAEMAVWEWSLNTVAMEKEVPIMTIADLQTIAEDEWEKQSFALVPACRYLNLKWNIAEFWEAFIKQAAFPSTSHYDDGSHWLIYRHNLQVFYIPCSMPQVGIIQAFQQGKLFAELCEELCERLPEEEVVDFLINQIIDWVGKGLLIQK